MVKAVYIPAGVINVLSLANCKEIEIQDEESLLTYFEQVTAIKRVRILNKEFFLAYNGYLKEDPNAIASALCEENVFGKAILYVYDEENEVFENCPILFFYQLFNRFTKRITYCEQDYKNEVYQFEEIMRRGNLEDRLIKKAKKKKI